jgi:mono/diheme cytochrome c family protein
MSRRKLSMFDRLSLVRLPLAVAAGVLAWTLCGTARAADFDKDVRPLLATYCVECHKPGKTKGDLDLARFATAEGAARSPEVWENVVQRMAAKEMPPAKSKQPSAAEVARLNDGIKSLGKVELDCATIANDETQKSFRGHVMSRRLNRAEYANTVRDLLGLDLPGVGDDLPADGAGGEGFDTVGDALFTSPIHVEQYLDAADRALECVLGDTKPTAERLGKDVVKAAQQRLLGAAAGLVASGKGGSRRDGTKPAAAADGNAQREAARSVIEAFAGRAFRRPAIAAEVDRYLKLFDRAAGRGDPFERSVKFALQGVLISPNFLFLVEPEADGEGIHPLGGYPLASRLSYFLWASMPDDELLKLAADGSLLTDDVLKKQVRRMLADPKARGLAERFALQWLDLAGLGETVKPDAKRFPQFTPKLATAMKQEAVLLVDKVLREDRPLTELLSADYTFVNEDLAKLYGLKDVVGGEMRQVTLPDRNRGGLLGMAGVHAVTSYALRTSPVLRGKWVLAGLLGGKVPPPPPDAGELPPDDKAGDGKKSFRQSLEAHRERAECASCHNRMDPLGFGLENFDAIGRWRTTDATGQPIDATGELPGGQKFNGPAELREVLLKRRDEFERNVTKKLLGYALGRDLRANGRRPGQFDQCVVDDCLSAMKKADGKSASVLETIVLSKPFRQRYTKK